MIPNNSSGIVVVSVPHYTSNRNSSFATSSDPVAVVRGIHDQYYPVSESVLNDIYNRFGGFKAFAVKNLSAELKRLRNTLMGAENFSSKDFMEIFDGTPKIGRDDARSYASQSYFLTDFDKFSRVWKASRLDAVQFMSHFHSASEIDYDGIWEHLPMVHAKECRGDEPGNLLAHFFCETPRIFHSDRALDATLNKKQELEGVMDPKVIDFIHENIFECTSSIRSTYAESLIVREDHWEKLAQDSNRAVLNKVADNTFLPTSVAEEIMATHKTPLLRQSIAKKSVDNDLLNKIWHGTKSASIRKSVEENSMFTLQ